MAENELPETSENGSGKNNDLPLGVRRYDFKTARKLTQAQRIKLGSLHSRMAAQLGRVFSEQLRVAAEVSFLGLEQVQGAAFQASEYGEVITAEIPIRPGVGRMYIVWPRESAFFVIEKVLGGTGDELFTSKELSEFEQGILKKYSEQVFRILQNAFDKAHPEGSCESIKEGMEAFAEQFPFEILLIGRLNLKLKQHNGKLTLIYPYSVIKPWLDESAANPDTVAPAASMPKGHVARGLANAPVSLMVKIEPTILKLSDFTSLQVGDCLQLNHATKEPFPIYVDRQLKFHGHLGVLGQQLAVKIADKLNAGPTGH